MASSNTPATGPDTEPRPGWWPLAIISSAHLMAVLDTTIMFVALPSIQHALKLTDSSRQWVVTAYTLALAGLLLLGGRLADKFGARRTLIIGVAGFAVASAVGGASVDGTMLIVARAVQGAFGAVLTSSTRSLLVTTYRGEQRGQAISLFTATLTAGLGVGLVLGGVITSALGWRWCLYLNLIFSAVVVLGAPRVLAPSPRRADVHIDLLSVVLASVGMVGLVYGLGEAAAAGWGSARVIGSLAAAVVLLGGFVLRPGGHTHRPAAAAAGHLRPQPRLGDGHADRQRAQHVRDAAHPHLPAPVGDALFGAEDRARARAVRGRGRAGLRVHRAPAD